MKKLILPIAAGFALAAFAVEKPMPPEPPGLAILGAAGDIPVAAPQAAPVPGWKGVGEKLLPVRFAAGDDLNRVAYDFPIRTGLAKDEMLTLDVTVSNPGVGTLVIYLKSGKGWYCGHIKVRDAMVGKWVRLELPRTAFDRFEDTPAGWNLIDGMRLAVYRPLAGASFSAAVGVANLSKRKIAAEPPEVRARREAEKAAFGKAADAWAKSLGGKANERRLMWCHSPLGLKRDGDWAASVKTLKSFGYTDLIANLVWGGCADYRSKVAVSTRVVGTHGDMLDRALAACRENGVRLHVWNVCWPLSRNMERKFGDELDREGRLQYDARGQRVRTNNTDWLCPSSPENRELVVKIMVELAERGVDGVHFDYIRYPGETGCYCAKCRARFEAQIGAACAAWPQDVFRRGAHRAAWVRFRADNITALVRQASEAVRARFPKVEVSAAVFRDPVDEIVSIGQDWVGWLRDGLVDFVCPMDYTWDLGDFVRTLAKQKAHVGTARVYPGIGLTSSARFPADGGDAYRFSEQVLEIRKAGFPGFTTFNFDARCVRAMEVAREGVLGTTDDVRFPEPVCEDGFVSLFNGRDLTGWEGATNTYGVAADGCLTCRQRDGRGESGALNLWTVRDYTNFVIRFDVKLPPNANNGLGIRTPPNGWCSREGMELQLLDDWGDAYNGSNVLANVHYTGSIYGVVGPARRVNGESYLKKPGEWNSVEVTADGPRIVFRLNGTTIVDADVSKYSTDGTVPADGIRRPGLHNKSGRIHWCGHGHGIFWKNIRIRELP